MPAADGRELERLAQELHVLTEIAKALASPLDLPELLGAVMERLSHVMEPAEIGAVMLWDASAGLFRAAATFGYDLGVMQQMGLRAGESITGKVYDAGVAQLLSTPDAVAAMMIDMRRANRETMNLDADVWRARHQRRAAGARLLGDSGVRCW